MDALDKKLNDVFTGCVVRKDLVKQVQSNAAVPGYVLEYLLGQNCATDDEELIEAGIKRVKEILAKHYVERAQAGAIRSDIKLKGFQRVIDKVSVELNEKRDAYEASFENLGIGHVLVDSDTVKRNRRLLVSGVWCICDLSYAASEARDESPYLLQKLKPIQMSRFDLDGYIKARKEFTTDEWIDVMIRSTGLDPDKMGRRSKLFMLTRLIPFCERNYNLVELGPKGTGKSHVFSELSPHGILISGGEVTPAKLFVNNSTGKIGLVGYWDCVAFDEFAGKNKKPKGDIVDILKNYMANKSFSRGVETVSAEASMVFVGNTSHDVSYMIKKTDLFEDFPAVYHDPAFLDRIHAYIPGWEMDIIRGDMFCTSFGFIVDYLAEALKAMRPYDYSGDWQGSFELHPTLSTRDRDGVKKTYSGLKKILFPGMDPTEEENAELLETALELRERVKDQLYRIDETFDHVKFAYRHRVGDWIEIRTLEEDQWPDEYHALDLDAVGEDEPLPVGSESSHEYASDFRVNSSAEAIVEPDEATDPASIVSQTQVSGGAELKEGLVKFRENQRGVSYEALFGAYLDGASNIEVIDPYLRKFYQCRNLMELMNVVLEHSFSSSSEVNVHVVTASDDYDSEHQEEYLNRIQETMERQGVAFSWEFQDGIHARHLVIDDKWDILLDRGLDIFQKFDANDAFCAEASIPELRRVKQFEITYLRKNEK